MVLVQSREWQIYLNIRIFLIQIFIRIFVRIKILIRIYSDIRSCQHFDTNIFGYSFVSNNFIRIYSDIRSCNFLDTNIFGYSFVSKSIQMSHSETEQVCQSCRFYDDEMQNVANCCSSTKYSWLPTRNAFSSPNLNLWRKKHILPALQKQPSIRSASGSSSEKISIQILLLFKLVQASKVDKMNDG